MLETVKEDWGIIIRHNKRGGLKLQELPCVYNGNCTGCYLFRIGRHCKRISDKTNLCGKKDIIYKKYYEDNNKR